MKETPAAVVSCVFEFFVVVFFMLFFLGRGVHEQWHLARLFLSTKELIFVSFIT